MALICRYGRQADLELRQLRNFLAIADAGSFTRAARIIGVVQPALSRDIRLLEHELGAVLFSRNGRGVTLTGEGAAFLAAIADHVSGIDSAKREMLARLPTTTGSIRIGWTTTVSLPLSSRVIAAFTRRFPGVELRAIGGTSAQLQEWVANDHVDIAVMNSERPSSGYATRTLMQAPLHFVASATTIKDGPSETIAFAEAATYPLFIHSRQNAIGRIVVDNARDRNIALHVYAVVDDFPAIRPMIRDGYAATIIAKSLMHGIQRDDNLVFRRIVDPDLTIYFLLTITKSQRSNPVVNGLAEIISTEIQAALSEGLIEGKVCAPSMLAAHI